MAKKLMKKFGIMSAFDFLEPKRCLSGVVATADPASSYPSEDAAYQADDSGLDPSSYDDFAPTVIYDPTADAPGPDDPFENPFADDPYYDLDSGFDDDSAA